MKLLLYCTKAKPYLYRQDDDTFFPENEDPQIIVSEINEDVKTLLLTFESNNHSDDSMQVYFKKESEAFSEENSVSVNILDKAKYVAVVLPADNYESIRIDINGKFELNDIVISSGEITGSRIGFVNSFSVTRVLSFFASLLVLVMLFMVAFERLKASNYKLRDIFEK